MHLTKLEKNSILNLKYKTEIIKSRNHWKWKKGQQDRKWKPEDWPLKILIKLRNSNTQEEKTKIINIKNESVLLQNLW